MSIKKQQPVSVDSEKKEHEELEAGARRHLLGLGLPAAVALFAAACGKNKYGDSGTNPSDLGAGLNGKPNPASRETGPAGRVDPTNPSGIQAEPVEPNPCGMGGAGILSPLPDAMSGSVDVKLKAYGDQADTMVVAKSVAFVAGDVLLLVAKIDNTKGKVIARRKLSAYDVAQRVIIFDGVHLGVSTTAVTSVVYRGQQQLRGPDFNLDAIFQVKIKNPLPNADQSMVYDVVDAFSIRGDNRYALKGAHPNYYDGSGLTVCMAFGVPTSPIQFGKQGPKGINDRAYVQSSESSQWASPGPAYLPTSSYVVCDAFGDVISASLMGNVNFLQNQSVLLVYVKDGNHFHRYFFHVG